MILGAQMYTVRDFCKTADDMKQSLKKVADIGYTAVQLSGHNWEIDPKLIAGWVKDNNLTVACTHIAFQQMKDDLPGVVATHKLWNCAYPGVGSMPQGNRDLADFENFAKEAEQVARKLLAEGLHFIYHNHHFEFARFGARTGMDVLMQNSGPAMQFEIDTHWVQAGGGDPAAWIRKMRGRMDIVHFKDMVYDPAERKGIICEIGEGNLNWDDIIAACREIGVKYALVEQDISKRDPFESLAMSYKFLSSKGVK